MEQEEADIVEEFRSEGMTVTELTEEELDAFKEEISGVNRNLLKITARSCEASGLESE